jgi:peptide/nickel transport system substrate-binding protein
MRRAAPLAMIVLIALTACAAPRTGSNGGTPSAGSSPEPSRTLVVAYGAEIDNLSTKLSTGVWAPSLNQMVNSSLTITDPQGEAHPRLASELPSQQNGSWVVNPDGTMRTTWRINPGARWQDGAPVTPQDFQLALRIANDNALPVTERRPEMFIDRIEPVDPHTFDVYWKQLYPWANELGYNELEPLPAHLLQESYETSSPDVFLAGSFWNSPDYVGAGPYRLVSWDRGTQMTFHAFDGYVAGRPKIDDIVFKMIPDPNAVIANLLSGEAQAAVGIALGQQAGATVKEQWAQSGEGVVLTIPTRYRFVDIQFKPDVLAQPALLDIRVRRALVHGLDRASLAEISTAGLTSMTDVFLAPTDRLYERAVAGVPKYPYDLSRALALLGEAGWTRRGDALVNASGEPFVLDIFSSEGNDNESEQSILASDLRKLGMNITQTVYPRSRSSDREFRASFVGLNPTALTIEVPTTLQFGLSDLCPRAPRYAGNNRGCWQNAEFDRLYQVATTSLDPTERGNAVIQAQRVSNEEVGKIPLAYRVDAIAARSDLVGLSTRWPELGDTWNVHEWRWK